MRKDNSIYNKKQPGLYIYLYLQSQIPTSCYSGKKTIRQYRLISGFLKKISSLCNFIKVTTRLTDKETN